MSERQQKEVEAILKQRLNHRKLSNEITLSTKITPTLIAEGVHFDCLMMSQQGILSTAAVFSGVFNQGQRDPSAGFVDGDYSENARFQSVDISLTDMGLDVPLFKILGELVPAGGSFLVSYMSTSPESRVLKQTEQALDRGYPPAVTPLGYLLFLAGCGVNLKDHRSPNDRGSDSSKLQGSKPLTAEEGKRKGLSLIRELHQFMGTRSEGDELARACRTRAFATIEKIHAMGG